MPDVRRRIAMARTSAGKLRRIWGEERLQLKLKMRLYISACCSILTYGSEAWHLDDRACKAINGANAQILTNITGKTIKEEATAATTTFNILKWVRARRLQWIGHILRLPEGDILMDVQECT